MPSLLLSSVFFLLAFAAAFAITALVRRHALANAILDIPNQRSSHSIPTPRGGGIAIAIVTLAGILVAVATGLLPARVALAVGGGGAAVALVGWADDKSSISAAARLTVQLAAAAWAVFWIGGMPSLRMAGMDVSLGAVGSVVAVLGITWVTNLFNFMDGIDGLAAAEAISVGVAGVVLMYLLGRPGMAVIPVLLVATSAGFLVWNWAPAKIFMGDVGSNFLGFTFGAFALASENSGGLPLVAWVGLALLFIVDATTTLARRLFWREKVYAAHRQHAYQRAVAAGYSHATVTLAAVAINGVLAVLVYAQHFSPSLGVIPLLLAPAILIGIYLFVEHLYPMRRA